jgi:hypothetical protein
MKLILLTILCAACAPVGSADDEQPAAARVDYATQVAPPSPDYSEMVVVRPPVNNNTDLRRAATAPLPPDAKAIGDLWTGRLQAEDAASGWGLAGKGEDGPVTSIDVAMSPDDFDAWVAENGWTVPRHISWSFVPRLSAPRVSPAAAPKIRYFPAYERRTGAQNQALLSGRVIVRDGCFWLQRYDHSEALAWFLGETGLDVDDEGYLILVERVNGETTARVGEMMSWAGPNADPTPEQSRELRAVCGDHPVAEVGNTEATDRMHVRYPHFRELRAPEPPR